MPVNKKKKHSARNRKGKSSSNLFEILSRTLNDADLPEEMKMSHKVLQLIGPWQNTVSNIATLLDMACIAWNLCVSEDSSDKSVDFLTNSVISYDGYPEMMDKLKARKMELFPDDYRTIVRAQVHYDETGELRLIVTSELKSENFAKMFANLAKYTKV